MFGLTGKPMKGNGRKTKCMGMVCLLGKMVKSTKDISLMTNVKVKVNSHGRTEESMMECGAMENNMVEENLYLRTT